MQSTVFEFSDYRLYLQSVLQSGVLGTRGARSRLAKAIGCQPGYLTRILDGDAEFSLEQADLANLFFKHTDRESDFFIVLVSLGRASTEGLRGYFEKQRKRLLNEHLNLKQRFKVENSLPEQHQAQYFSSWYYGAVHAAVSLPNCKTREEISSLLQIPTKRVSEILTELQGMKLVRAENKRFVQGSNRLHLGADSALISKHHANWRLKAMQSLESPEENDLHYSSVISVSENDYESLRSLLINTIEKAKSTIKASKDEMVASFCIDLFTLGK